MSNLIINTGSAATIATDTIGTVNYQIVKIAQGIAGNANALSSNFAVVATAHPFRFQGFVIATTSAAGGVIVVTSGANTLYITDVLISVTGAMNVQLCTETTAKATLYLAANGGWAQSFVTPIVCNSAQSLRVILSSSGAAAISVQGYTVT